MAPYHYTNNLGVMDMVTPSRALEALQETLELTNFAMLLGH